jgi:flagellar basal-body rod protein FlgF
VSRDLYTSLSGASSVMRQLEMLSHNVSNSNTAGYKEFRLVFEESGPGDGALGKLYATPHSEVANMEDGPLERTGDPNHLALRGEGFFLVETPAGLRMSRAGNFSQDVDGYLIDNYGNRVMGEGGAVQIPQGESFTVTRAGEIVGSLSGELDRLRLVTADDPKSEGAALWNPRGGMREAAPEVIQGALEGSNVDPMRVMVELIEASRHFEAQQKLMQTSDSMDERVNRSGGQS